MLPMTVEFPSQYGTARKVQRLVVLREEQQAKHGQGLLLALTHLRELNARAIRALWDYGEARWISRRDRSMTAPTCRRKSVPIMPSMAKP